MQIKTQEYKECIKQMKTKTTLPLSRSQVGNRSRDLQEVAYCIVGTVFHGKGGDTGIRNTENM
jgi:hypothetical protein